MANIEKENKLDLEEQLVLEIKHNPTKRVICFADNKLSDSIYRVSGCTKFAAGIQGFQEESFTYFWMQVNLGAATKFDFSVQAPADFYEKYKIFRADGFVVQGKQYEENPISEFITND
jgi:hypothetical protein